MVLRMIDHAVESCNQIGVPATAKPTLEDRELHPCTVSLHRLEHLPPSFRVGDVVDNDVEVLHDVTA